MAIKENRGAKNLNPKGKPFEKGKSGNPAGRPPMKDVQQVFKDFLMGDAEFKAENGKVVGRRQRLEMIMQRLFKDAMNGKTSSTDILLERALGKAKNTIAHEGLNDLTAIDGEQRRRILMAAYEEMGVKDKQVVKAKRPAK